MTLKINKLATISSICLSALFLAPNNVKAQHSSPKPIAGRFLVDKNFDKTVAPGDDFFEFANGNWMKENPIPAKESRWGSFNILRDDNVKQELTILKDVSAKPGQPKGSLKQRVGDMYASGMDTLSINKRGFNPIRTDLMRITQINSTAGVINETVVDRMNGISSPLFGIGIGQDSKAPTKYIVNINQGGTILPDRDNYLKDDAPTKKIQDAYHTYMVSLFTLTGSTPAEAEKNANAVFNVEKKLATAQWDRVSLRDANKRYNKFAVADLPKLAPHIDMAGMLTSLKMPGQDSILIGQPSFVKSMDSLLAVIPANEWATYLKWHALSGAAPSLSKPFVDANFAFTAALRGQKVQIPRNERIAAVVDGTEGELLGQLYVQKYFSADAKLYMVKLVDNLKIALGDRIKKLDWMSDATKARALKKLASFTVKIAYPDKWLTYDGLAINRDDYYGNLRRAAQWRYNDNVNQLGKPVDKTRWGMTPPTVNAYYNPVNNEIVFPAGILHFPFFDPDADDAMNYGGIGVVIGHEMTHGFDDQGRKYDGDGTLRDWWTAEDAAKFKVKADLLAAQYSTYTVVDTATHVNGKLTLGENLADLGGVNIAYEAFKKTREGQSTTKIDGFTPDQRFFLSFAQVWRGSSRDEAARQQVQVDPHSPGQFRTIGPIINVDAWYNAFDIKPTNKLYKKPEDRIKIW